MELTILGTSSSQPTPSRFCTSQVLHFNQSLYLIDCGEGCQIQLSRFHIKRNQIKAILISHLHGDHFYGLPGVLTSFMHYGRTAPLKVFGPKGIEEFINSSLRVSLAYLSFELQIIEIDPQEPQLLLKDDILEISCFPLDHSIPTCGFRFTTNPVARKIDPSYIQTYSLTFDDIKNLKLGLTITNKDGNQITSDMVCQPPAPRIAYAFASDTCFNESILPHIQGVDVLYHEATYLQEMGGQAKDRKHSTTHDAATIALKAKVGKLIIGHYSSRYKDISLFETECRDHFENSYAAYDGMNIKIG
jgi:ribonuclease Z